MTLAKKNFIYSITSYLYISHYISDLFFDCIYKIVNMSDFSKIYIFFEKLQTIYNMLGLYDKTLSYNFISPIFNDYYQ